MNSNRPPVSNTIRPTKPPSNPQPETSVTLLTTKPKEDVDAAALRLKKAWRTYASSIAVISSRASAAEKLSKNNASSTPSSSTNSDPTAAAADKKKPAIDDDSFNTTFKARSELKKMITLIESRIKNESRENELLKSFWMSESCVGRKRIKIEESSNGNTTAAVVNGDTA